MTRSQMLFGLFKSYLIWAKQLKKAERPYEHYLVSARLRYHEYQFQKRIEEEPTEILFVRPLGVAA